MFFSFGVKITDFPRSRHVTMKVSKFVVKQRLAYTCHHIKDIVGC